MAAEAAAKQHAAAAVAAEKLDSLGDEDFDTDLAKNNLTSALGQITLPISRPSIQTWFCFANFFW